MLRIHTELSWEYLFNPITRPSEPDAETGGEPESMDNLSCLRGGCAVRVGAVVGLLERRGCGLTRNPFAAVISEKDSQTMRYIFLRFASAPRRAALQLATELCVKPCACRGVYATHS